jgi:predicted transcriptional regulator
MIQPQEVVVAKLLPTIRARVAKELLRTYHMRQIDVAQAMGLTQAAVSHYNTQSRGVDQDMIRRFPEIKSFVDGLAARIHKGLSLSDQISQVDGFCASLMLTARFCEYHKSVGDIDPNCTACFSTPPKP